MPDVFVEGRDGKQFKLIRDRNFGVFESKSLVLDNLLEKARYKEAVFFYDLGCGEGYAATDFFEHIRKEAAEKGQDPSLADRIFYIGVDRQAGDAWNEDPRIRFYEGSLAKILSDPKLPNMDVGLANWVIPYMDDKAEALHRIAEKLSDDDGIFFGTPFYSHQLSVEEGKMNPEYALQDLLPLNVDINLPGSKITLVRKGVIIPKQIFLAFTHSTPDFHQFSKNGYIGYPGQRVSHYKIVQ